MRRRDALKSIGALAGAGAASRLLPGCGGDDDDDGGSGSDAGPPGSITTLVVVMMENRSYDHYFGARALLEGLPGDGLVKGMSNPDMAGSPIEIYRETDFCVADPPHGWDESRAQFNGGANDGFVRAYRDAHAEVKNIPPFVMGYFGREDLPFSWSIADQYASCDRWFSSVMGPTYPNRTYLHSGQSGGRMVNDSLEELTAHPYDWPTIYHKLAEADVPWGYYYSDLPFLFLWGPNLPNPERNMLPLVTFFADAAAGTLPPLTMVDPAFGKTGNDDHPPKHPILGQAFLASVYAALANSPQWNNTLLVVTYDEHGGLFDHVAPPLAADDRADQGFDQLGFRVPAMAAGPYVKRGGYVSSVVRDHTSILKHLGGMFGLSPMTARVAAAEDLSELIDQERLAANNPAPPAEVPAIVVDPSTFEPECLGAAALAHEPSDLEKLADAGFFPPELDRRSEARDLLYFIGEQLERFNAG